MEAVKPKRAYKSSIRNQQASVTRGVILEAAKRIFEKQGYAATTIQAIAAEADVVPKTVYTAFATKSGVLSALWDVVLRGGEDAPPVGALPWYREVIEEPAPERQLRLNARNSRIVKQRIAGVISVIRDGATSDSDVGRLWSDIENSFYRNQEAIVTSIASKKALKTGLNVKRATDILWTLAHPDLWRLLVSERNWTPEAYEKWFGDTACDQLLR
jgi:AcrR family transcriptional regulator